MEEQILIFGYGSLMNPESLAKTSATAKILRRIFLTGYQRKANAMCDAFPEIAMNIVPNENTSIEGVLITFPKADLPDLKVRETGYEMVEVTGATDEVEPVFTFIAPNSDDYQGKKIRQEYLDVCLAGVPEGEQERWLADTVIECEISGQPKDRVYRHA